MIEVSYGLGIVMCTFCGGFAGYLPLSRDLFRQIVGGEAVYARPVFCSGPCEIASTSRLDERVNEAKA